MSCGSCGGATAGVARRTVAARPAGSRSTHDPSNLSLRCNCCHRNHHAGLLTISGTAPDRQGVRRRPEHRAPVGIASEGVHVGATRLDAAVLRVQARDALVGLGWKPAIARAAVDEACAHVDATATIETVIREALRRCPRPLG